MNKMDLIRCEKEDKNRIVANVKTFHLKNRKKRSKIMEIKIWILLTSQSI